jgi:hypothetical protein
MNASKWMFVNCWHMAKHESAAMWKLYTSENHSICIRSTYQQLWDCLPAKHWYLGTISYLDYDSEFFEIGNLFNFVMHKRTSFTHEQEVRAVVMAPPQMQETHKVIDIDLKALIHDVYIGPTAAPPLLDVVQKLLDDAGFAVKVRQSDLNAPPLY